MPKKSALRSLLNLAIDAPPFVLNKILPLDVLARTLSTIAVTPTKLPLVVIVPLLVLAPAVILRLACKRVCSD